MSFSRTAVILALLVVAEPGVARADWLIIPFVGVNFGGDSGRELGEAIDASRFNWGASFGFMGAGVIGLEADFGYSPDFFGKTDFGGTSVFSAMGNLLLGIPFGGQQGFGVRPYGLVGFGVMRTDGDAFSDPLLFEENKVAWNFGGGVMIFFASHVGIRADLRYLRAFEAQDVLDELAIDLDDQPGELDFARGSLGFILRF